MITEYHFRAGVGRPSRGTKEPPCNGWYIFESERLLCVLEIKKYRIVCLWVVSTNTRRR